MIYKCQFMFQFLQLFISKLLLLLFCLFLIKAGYAQTSVGDGLLNKAQNSLVNSNLGSDLPPGPLEMVVIFAAGTSADVTARILAERMSKYLNKTITVLNKPGGGGAIGYKYVASSKPDGRSFIWNSNSVSTAYYSGMMDIDYKSFDSVARVSIELPAIVVSNSSQWKSLPELLAYARANPERLKVGNSGTGSHTHMASVALFNSAGVQVTDVPFSASQVVPSLLGGHVDALIQLPGAFVSHVQSGSLKVLAVLGSKREPLYSSVPNISELGINLTGMDLWRGLAVPKGTPAKAISSLERAVELSSQSTEFINAGQKLGFLPAFMTSKDFSLLIAKDDAYIAKEMQALSLNKK